MDEIISRANTPSIIQMEEEAQEMSERSCLSGGRGQQQHFENWHQIPMLSVSARAAPVALMPVCSVRDCLEPLALERPVTPVASRVEWANTLGSPLSTPVKVIASFYRKMTTRSTDDAQETKASWFMKSSLQKAAILVLFHFHLEPFLLFLCVLPPRSSALNFFLREFNCQKLVGMKLFNV